MVTEETILDRKEIAARIVHHHQEAEETILTLTAMVLVQVHHHQEAEETILILMVMAISLVHHHQEANHTRQKRNSGSNRSPPSGGRGNDTHPHGNQEAEEMIHTLTAMVLLLVHHHQAVEETILGKKEIAVRMATEETIHVPTVMAISRANHP